MKTVVNRIKRNMTEFPTSVSRGTPVLEAYEVMKQMEVRHLPVLESDRVIGIVSDRDVKQGRLYAGSKITVGEVMTQNPYCVPLGTSLASVAKEMAIHKYDCAVILNRTGKVVGIFTTTDGMHILSDILASNKGTDLKNWAIERLIEAGPWIESVSEVGI